MKRINIIIQTLMLSFMGVFPVFAENIDGTWFLNGFHTDVNANNFLPVTESITGSATIDVSAGTISFDTNMASWTEEGDFVKEGDTYKMAFPSTGDPDYMIAIRMIDEDTLAITLAQIWLDSSEFDIEGTEGFAGVLTKEQIPAPDANAWVGEFTGKGMILKEVENDGDAVRLQKEDLVGLAIEANPSETSYKLVAGDPDESDENGFADDMVQVGNALHWEEYDDSDYVLWSDSFITTRHVETRDQVRMLQLADGKLAFFVIYNQRARTVSSSSSYNNIRFISEFEYGSIILVPDDGPGDGSEVEFAEWSDTAGLTGDDASPTGIPFGDGVPNLLKFAFNMNGSGPDSSTMAQGGTAGLPVAGLDTSGDTPVWRVEFVRRKGSGLIYTLQISTTLAANSFEPMTGSTTITDIDEEWERVVIEEPFDPASTPRSFIRVEVVLPEN